MAVPRLRVPPVQPGGSLRQAAGLSSDEVELYHRTYTTLLRSSGETQLRVLESSHRAMGSSLHPLAASAMKPRPSVMFWLNDPTNATDRYAPPSAASIPETVTAT